MSWRNVPAANGGLQVAIRRGDDTNIHRDRLAAPDAFEFPLLKNSQQSDLRLQRKLANLVQKDRSAVGRFKTAEAPLQRAGEGALFMPE